MSLNRRFTAALLLTGSLALAGCGKAQDSSAEAASGWEAIAAKAQADVREEMATKNLDIGKRTPGLPRAQLSPQGDLLIGGEAVPLDDDQRALLLDYRTHLAGIAEDGAAIGLEAAGLAGKAMKEVAAGLFSGNASSIEDRVKEEAAKIEVAARALCDRLPLLLESQRAAADAIPEFRPYATMTEEDVERCGDDLRKRR